MELREFSPLMAFLSAAVQKQVSAETVKVYFDLLNDIPIEILKQAVRAAVIEHQYATIPPVAKIRQIAAALTRGPGMTAMESLAGVRRVVNQFGGGYASTEDREAAYRKMPPTVARCLQSFGWDRFCDSENPETLQAQWRMNWDQVQAREQRVEALPCDLRTAIERKPVAIPAGLFEMPRQSHE